MNPLHKSYPEFGAGGFSRFDGTLEFYCRVNALLQPHFRVLDIGAGRAGWFSRPDEFRRRLRLLKGKVREVVGQDVDPVVLTNPTVDRAVVTKPDEPLPFEDKYFDLIVADFVLEHVALPQFFASEVRRTLKPGGWFCARTPNSWGYISIATRVVRSYLHAPILRYVQPERKEIDIFPTNFRLNTMRAIRNHFPGFTDCSYYYQAEPSYHFNSWAVLQVMRALDWMMPTPLRTNLFLFLRREQD